MPVLVDLASGDARPRALQDPAAVVGHLPVLQANVVGQVPGLHCSRQSRRRRAVLTRPSTQEAQTLVAIDILPATKNPTRVAVLICVMVCRGCCACASVPALPCSWRSSMALGTTTSVTTLRATWRRCSSSLRSTSTSCCRRHHWKSTPEWRATSARRSVSVPRERLLSTTLNVSSEWPSRQAPTPACHRPSQTFGPRAMRRMLQQQPRRTPSPSPAYLPPPPRQPLPPLQPLQYRLQRMLLERLQSPQTTVVTSLTKTTKRKTTNRQAEPQGCRKTIVSRIYVLLRHSLVAATETETVCKYCRM